MDRRPFSSITALDARSHMKLVSTRQTTTLAIAYGISSGALRGIVAASMPARVSSAAGTIQTAPPLGDSIFCPG